MSINRWAINSAPVGYGSGATVFGGTGTRSRYWSINAAPVNSGWITVAAGNGSLISFTQEVELRQTGEGSLIDITQSVRNSATSGALITISQVVKSQAQSSFLDRNGWYPILVLNGVVIPDNQINGLIELSRIENDAGQLKFSLIVSSGTVDITSYEGKTIQLYAATSSSSAQLMYSGYVNIPELDLIQRKIHFICSDNRRERIIAQMAGQAPYLGYYTQEVFGLATDLADEMEKRLTTIPYAVDIAPNGVCTTTPLLGKSVADYTLSDSDVYRDDGRDPQVFYTPRSRIINRVQINAEYRYQRAYHRQLQFNWTASYASNVCDFLANGYSIASREMVQTAADGAGWPLRGTITFTPVLAAGFYNCGGFTTAWATAHYTSITTPLTESVRNSDGTVTTRNKLDANGRPIYQATPTSYVDTGSQLCFGAQWLATTRWTQNITELYVLVVNAPQSQTVYGSISQEDNIGVTSEFDSGAWEDYKSYRGQPTGWTATTTSTGSYYINFDTNLSNWYTSAAIAINKANTTIIKTHRDNRVVFHRSLWPQVDLTHTVALNCTRIQARGKVYAINHVMNVGTGEAYTKVELALSRMSGSSSTSSFALPARPTYSIPSVEPIVNLQSHYGQDPTTHPEWNGHIGNKFITSLTSSGSYDTRKTTFPHQFVVDTPSIEPAARDNVTLGTTQGYNISIQNDPLTVVLLDRA